MRPISSIPVSLPLSPAPGVLSRQKTRTHWAPPKERPHDHHAHPAFLESIKGGKAHALRTRRGPGPEHPASQRAQAIKRRKAIWEALHPNTVQNLDEKRGPGRPTEFATDTAKVSGESRSGIYQHLARAEALGDDLPRVTGTSLDKGVEPLDF